MYFWYQINLTDFHNTMQKKTQINSINGMDTVSSKNRVTKKHPVQFKCVNFLKSKQKPSNSTGCFFSDPILRAHCVHTINAIDLRFFALYCGNLEILFGTKNTNLLQEIR